MAVRCSAHRVNIGRERISTDLAGSKTSSRESHPSPGHVRTSGPGGRLTVHTVRVQVPDNPTHYERMAGGGRRAAKISSNWDPYLKGEEATIPEMSKLQVGAVTYQASPAASVTMIYDASALADSPKLILHVWSHAWSLQKRKQEMEERDRSNND